MPEDGWVRMYHPDQVDSVPDPDDPEDATKVALVTQESYDRVWEPRGWKNADADRENAEAVVEDMPEKAGERIAWIDDADSPEDARLRAQAALDDEEAREGGGRTTVISHAEAVLASTAPADQTPDDNPDTEE